MSIDLTAKNPREIFLAVGHWTLNNRVIVFPRTTWVSSLETNTNLDDNAIFSWIIIIILRTPGGFVSTEWQKKEKKKKRQHKLVVFNSFIKVDC